MYRYDKAEGRLESWLFGRDTSTTNGVAVPRSPTDPDALTALAAILMDPRSDVSGSLRRWDRAAKLLTDAVTVRIIGSSTLVSTPPDRQHLRKVSIITDGVPPMCAPLRSCRLDLYN